MLLCGQYFIIQQFDEKFEQTKTQLNIGMHFCDIPHRSVQSQLQTKNFPDIWHMPSYSLISWVPKTGKNKKIQRGKKKLGPIKVFSI